MIRKMVLCQFVLLIVLSGGLQAQFARTYGGTGADAAIRILTTPENGFLVGTATNFGTVEGFVNPCLMKLADDGSLQWGRSYDLTGLIALNSICPAPDGGYLMAGGNSSSLWLAKVDAGGEPVWQRGIANSVAAENLYYAVCPAADDGFFVVGSTSSEDSNIWVIKFSSAGDVIGQTAFGLGSTAPPVADWDVGKCGAAAADGGFVIAGMSGPNTVSPNKVVVFKIDALGTVAWQKAYAAVDYGGCDVASIGRAEGGGYILAGTLFNSDEWGNSTNRTGFVYKVGEDGTLEWVRAFAGADMRGASPALDGGAVAVGKVGEGDSADMLVLKLRADGDIDWQKAIGGCFEEDGAAVIQTPAGDYAAAGLTGSFGAGATDALAVRISSEGELGSCGFSASSSLEAATPNVNEEDIVLSDEETVAASETAALVAGDTTGHIEAYQLCTDNKLLRVFTELPALASAITPPPGTHIYANNESVTLSATNPFTVGGSTYNFSGWDGDVWNGANAMTLVMTDDMSVRARYTMYNPPPPPPPPPPEGCFIATAAYRSPLHPAVGLLREFRDRRLLTNGAGRALVEAYYRWSPPAAKVISGSGVLRLLARVLLVPVIMVAFVVLKLGWIPAFLLMAVAAAVIIRRNSLRRRARPA
jgi:hypothetical protein